MIFLTVLVSSVLVIIIIIRNSHCSWDSPSGLILLGGDDGSERTSEKIEEDGTSSERFELKYETR